jgi:hypothetical protein
MADEIKGKNIYQKVQQIRVDLMGLHLKKTGRNTYSNFSYYELGDFLPALNKLMNENGIMTRFSIQPETKGGKEKAILQIFNCEKPDEEMIFYTGTAEAEIGRKKDGSGGAEPIQNLGGKITYMRRYLLMIAFEIVESEWVDKNEQNAPDKKEEKKLDEEDIKKIEGAKTLDELTLICKGIKEKKGPEFQKVLLEFYTKKKGEIENESVQP